MDIIAIHTMVVIHRSITGLGIITDAVFFTNRLHTLMDIKSALNNQSSLSSIKNIADKLGLKLGQKLEVKVENIQAHRNQITLNLSNKLIQVQSPQASSFKPGQPLQLVVNTTTPNVEFIIQEKATSQPQTTQAGSTNINRAAQEAITLKLMTLLPEKTTSNLAETGTDISRNSSNATLDKSTVNNFTVEAKAELFKQLLPKQESPAIAINQLIKEMPKLAESENVPKKLKRLAAQIMQSLPNKQQLNSGQAVKQSVSNSGLFLETKISELAKSLNQNNTTETSTSISELKLPEALQLSKDLKLNLLKLITLLKQETTAQAETRLTNTELDAIKNLLQKSEHALAKIILDQFSALPKEESPKQVWNIELPFINQEKAETVQLEIEQDKNNNSDPNEGSWSVNITLTPPKLGTIHCKISQHNGTINSRFWSNKPQVSQMIHDNLDYLVQQLEDSGLNVGHINAQTGQPDKTSNTQIIGMQLFDEKV